MKITFLTPGTGSYYCGACMRDNALANALIEEGHEVDLLPMYLPLMLDERSEALTEDTPIFFGGINIYLQQKLAFFRRAPLWVDRILDRPGLLRSVAKRSHMTSAQDHGEMTFEMLRLDGDQFRRELEKLYSWMRDNGPPDVLCLSTALMAGFAREIKKQWDIPAICCFQGEDGFLDSLPDEYRDRCWEMMAEKCRDADCLLAPSRSYGRMMESRLGLSEGTVRVQPNGINLEGYRKRREDLDTPVIGFLARMCEVKGLALLIDAFIHLRNELGVGDCRLKIGGAQTKGDEPLIANLKGKLDRASLSMDVEWSPNLSREGKLDFLQELTLFSVPVLYEEAFGLYVLEAMAASVPVVQPDCASFPEIIERTGGGVCVPIENAKSLAEVWRGLLEKPERLKEMGEEGRLGVEKAYSLKAMTGAFLSLAETMSSSPA